MAEVIRIFQNLSQFYAPHLSVDMVEDIYEKVRNQMEDPDENEDSDSEDPSALIANISIVKMAVNDTQVLSLVLELCTAIRSLRESNTGYDNTFDCWDRLIETSPKEKYLTFVYTLLKLAQHDATSKIYRKLTMATARAYILSLTIPGSKGFHIFDDNIIECALESFRLINALQSKEVARCISKQDRIELWVNFSNLCDDLKIMFRYVHFDEYKDVRNTILWELNKLLYNNHVNGYENIYAANLHSKCFEIFDEVTNAHNGDPEDTFMKIMRITYCLHVFPASPKHNDSYSSSGQFCEHISDWFINVIDKYPRIVTKVLNHFIECVITNPEKEWRGEQMQRVLDYAAKYDSALYVKCNESALPFLRQAANADDVQIRSNATEMLNRLLIIESKVNWEVFTHEISNIPREIHVIKELVDRLIDTNNSIKLKAVNGLLQAYLKGTKDAIKIMTEGMKFAVFDDPNVSLPVEPRIRLREIRYQRPTEITPSHSVEGHEIVKPCFAKLPSILYYLLRNALAHIRRATTVMIEHYVALNPFVIYNTRFVQETSRLGDDPSPLVRKQSLIMIDSILDKYSNCYPVIYAWCKIIVPLFKDSDSKIVDQAWECFRKRVFDNIKGIDNSNNAEHFMPWMILRVLLSIQQRQFLQSCIQSAITKQIINQKVLDLIESHTLTSNSTEAWIMLSIIAGKMKSKEPDALICSFIKSMLDHSWNAGQNLQIILEVLVIWVNDFSHTALNLAFSCILNLMKTGTIPPNVVSKAFNFCMTISSKSENTKNKSKKFKDNDGHETEGTRRGNQNKAKMKWIEEIHQTAEVYLLENLRNFNSNRTMLMSYLFSYTEANMELLKRPHEAIVHFVHKYLEEYIDAPDEDYEPEDINTLNQMILLAGRFSIRDATTAGITCLLYRLMLQKTDRSTSVNNIIVCITDLCKRHTQTVELALSEMLTKLKSPFLELRLVTFKNLAQLVLQDLMKLRGNLLLSLMATLLDKNKELSNRATEFFFTYLEKKNPSLFQTCLLECPFVYNNYLNFEGFESFTPSEMKINSPLKGEENIKARQKLYHVFMLEQEEIFLLMFFENLKMLYNKVLKDPLIKCDEGCFMIKDMFFIMTEICYISQDKHDSKSSQQNSESANDCDEDPAPSTSRANDAEPQTSGKRKDSLPTMKDALSVVEKMLCFVPKISEIIIKWDTSFEEPITNLATAICIRFDSLTEFLQPVEFWGKYRLLGKKNATAIRKARSEKFNEADNGEEETGNLTDDNSNARHSIDVPISLLFKPFLV